MGHGNNNGGKHGTYYPDYIIDQWKCKVPLIFSTVTPHDENNGGKCHVDITFTNFYI